MKSTAENPRTATDPGGPTGRLVTWLAGLQLDDVPEHVRTRAKYLTLDGIGCALVGAQLPWSRKAVEAVASVEGPGDRTVIGWGRKLGAPAAALLNGQAMDYYDYVRARLAGGRLLFDPVTEVREMVRSNCADLSYRADAVNEALQAGMQNRPQPPRLPMNIYGTEGDWETYSTPSRDARLKTAFKELRDNAERFITLYRAHDRRLAYGGANLAADLLTAYDQAAAGCAVSYIRSDGMRVTFGYEQARQRLFRLSFDPYHCVERRWGAEGAELSACRDGRAKRAWYDAEQGLRNQIDRTYEARMDFSLDELGGSGVPQPPDTDARGYLLRQLP